MKLNYIFCAALLLLSAVNARPQVFEATPFYGYRWGGDLETSSGDELDLDGGQAYGVDLTFGPRDSEMKMELLWSRQDSGLDLGFKSLDVTVDQFMFGGIYEERYGKLRGYLSLAVGASVFDAEGSDAEAKFAFTVGGGVKYYLIKNVALRADVRGYCTVVESESAFISSGGVTVATFTGTSFWQGEVTAGITISF